MPDQDKNKKKGNSKIPRTVAPNTAGIQRFNYTNMPNSSDQEVVDWTVNYINSPKYRERLSKFYSNPNQVIDQRTKRVNDVKIINYNDSTGESGSVYHQDDNVVIMNNNDPYELKTTRDDILAHELSHITNYNPKNKNLGLIPEEENYIFDRERTYGYTNDYMIQNPDKKSQGQFYKDEAKRRNIGVSQMLFSINPNLHDFEPMELKSDVDALRFQLNKAGLYDAGTQNMNQEILDKAKKDIRLNSLFNFKRLQEHYNDKDLIDIMNNIAMNNTSTSNIANNGKKLANGGPGDNKKKPTSKEIKQKYANNPYVVGGREQWGEYLDTKTLPFSGTSVKKAIYNAAKTTKIDPDLLYASAMEEGLREGIDDPDAISEAYEIAIGEANDPKTGKKKQQFDPDQFPIDGFRTYGLDTFGDQFESLQRKGYLPKNFKDRFTTFKALNEIEEKKKARGEKYSYVNTAAFRTEDDAIIAKAAILRNTRDNLNNYTKKVNIPLTEKQRDFFTLVGYNAGEGNMQKMIKSYKDKGYLKDDKFLTNTNFKPASYAQPYTYAQRRLQNMDVLNNEGYFQDYIPPGQENMNTTNSTNSTNMNKGGKISRYHFQNGGKVETEDPTIPKGYKPLSQQNRQDWNNFVRYLNRDIKVGGSKDLDNRTNAIGLNYLNEYKKANPNFSITPEMVPYIQYEFQQLKNTNSLPDVQPQGRVRTLVQNYFNDRQVSPVDGWIGSLTSRQGYPEVQEFSDDPNKKIWGLDYEGASQFEQANWNGRQQKGSMNNGGYVTFNPEIYNDLYPDGAFTNLHMNKKFNNGGSIYDVVPNGFNPSGKKRKDPWTPYMDEANFGYGEGFYTEAVAKDGIHIKKENRGKFTASAKRAGMGVQEYARHILANKEDYSSTLVKRANFARNASKWKKGQNGINLPFMPNAVSTPENPIFYEDPLEEAKKNITNFFNDPQNNQVINDASLNLNPDMQGTYEDTGFSGIGATPEQINNANRPSTGQRVGQAISNVLSGVSLSTAPLIMGTAAVANMATRGQQEAQEYARRVRRYSQQDVYNPIRYGTGSQAIFNNGGNLGTSYDPETQVKMLSDNQFSSPTYEFVGPSHEEGGIDISYAGNNVEVEGGETVFMDNGGDLNVFGNMYVPGTNKKFKNVSKSLSTTENKIQKDLDNSVNLVNQNNPTIKYEKFKFNAGKVMMGANKEKLQELNEIKNELSDMQNLMLEQGFTEESSKELNYGGKIKRKMTYDDGGELFDEGRSKKKVSRGRPVIPTVELMKGPSTPITQPVITPPSRRLTTINQTDEFDYTPPIVESEDPGTSRDIVPPTRRRSSMPFGQILPEILTIATERPEFVPGQTYEPNLYTPYQVSFQDRLNENNSTFRALQLSNPNNPALLSQLAGQKYEADARVLADEFRTNQGIQNQITNQNTELLNQAQLTNIQLADQQFVRQSQARSNTRENIRNAINSISSKVAQSRLEDQTLAVYENMFPHFTFDENAKLRFQDVDRPTFTNGTRGGNVLSTQRTRVKYDSNGKVKETQVTTPSKRDMDKLDLQIDKARTQRLGLFESIFGKRRR